MPIEDNTLACKCVQRRGGRGWVVVADVVVSVVVGQEHQDVRLRSGRAVRKRQQRGCDQHHHVQLRPFAPSSPGPLAGAGAGLRLGASAAAAVG